ncbi:MAG: hypothetical protein IT305_20195 [Chloroflexi bacterium]|nr:hypothetical protein [Chloroflexota bacterium]
MDEQRPADMRASTMMDTATRAAASTVVRGICDECGKPAVLTPRIDPESPLSGSERLCPTCARSPEPFWHDDR